MARSSWKIHFLVLNPSILVWECSRTFKGGLNMAAFLPRAAPHRSTGCVWYCSSTLFFLMELCCGTGHGPWTGVLPFLQESSHVLHILDSPFKAAFSAPSPNPKPLKGFFTIVAIGYAAQATSLYSLCRTRPPCIGCIQWRPGSVLWLCDRATIVKTPQVFYITALLILIFFLLYIGLLFYFWTLI